DREDELLGTESGFQSKDRAEIAPARKLDDRLTRIDPEETPPAVAFDIFDGAFIFRPPEGRLVLISLLGASGWAADLEPEAWLVSAMLENCRDMVEAGSLFIERPGHRVLDDIARRLFAARSR